MPIALDPKRKIDFSLASDAEMPDETRPVFACRYLTCRQVIDLQEYIDQAVEKGVGNKKSNQLLNRALATLIVGWKNLPVEFEVINTKVGDANEPPEIVALDGILTPAEKWEIVTDAYAAIRLSERDKKKSVSQRALDMGKSAQPAVEDATTVPAK